MKKILILLLLVISCSSEKPKKEISYCNPMNLNYRFQFTNELSYREAADPTMLRYKDKYILFASHSGGYWFSDDLFKWDYIPVKSLPIEDYAPDAITINDTVYYTASSAVRKPFYYSTDPLRDIWQLVIW